ERTDGLMEFPGWRRGQRRNARRRSGLPLLLVAAAPAAGRFVLEPALLIEGLLSQGEHELFATVATLDYLFSVSHGASETPSPAKKKKPPTGECRGGTVEQTTTERGAPGNGRRRKRSLP